MTVLHRSVSMHLDAEFGHRDVTREVGAWVSDAGVKHGLVCLQLVGSTGGLTTIEYEPGALADLRRALSTLAPADGEYDHNARWGDGNGFSHVRSALLKTGITVPVVDGELQLGTWQQVVAINFDNRPRERTLVGLIVGD
jgi:secondary thiamine-phosphate synthase enzyme